jgi:hypothetical protein
MTSYTSEKLAFNNAEQFKESFSETLPTIGYVFIGNHIAYENEDSPDFIIDSVVDEKSVWDNMYAAKRITGNDVQLVVTKYNWTSNTRYKQYDDTKELEFLLTKDEDEQIFPMYVVNSEGNVYKCLCNNVSQFSNVEPLGKNLSANGNIATTDGYLWKYMFNVKPSNRFLTDEWIPAPTSTKFLEFDASPLTSVDGELAKIIMVENGSGYFSQNVVVSPFTSGCTVLSVVTTVESNVFTLVQDTSISGTGVATDTHIISINTNLGTITLSKPTSGSGGGVTNTLNSSTRVVVEGDGTPVTSVPTLSNTSISKITVTSFGSGYTFANVKIFGTGTGASARAVFPPKFGHSFNAAKELGASNVMVAMRIGEVDSTEGGVISTDTSFRQYGFMRDPYKYGQDSPVNLSESLTVISQTTDVTLIAGAPFDLQEFVYQGNSPETATFSGFVHAQTANEVRLTRVRGSISIGVTLKGTFTNQTGRAVVTLNTPEFEPYTGDVLYTENIVKTQRTDGQAENLKFVIRF